MITDAERERIQGLSMAAQWAELQMQLPGLECRCLDQNISGHNCATCAFCWHDPDLALLLAAMSKAGFVGVVCITDSGSTIGFGSCFWPNDAIAEPDDEMVVTGGAPTTAAVEAACLALAAEKGANHDAN